MVLVRDKKDLLNSFSTQPEYLKDLETDNDSINPGDLGMELTRPTRGLKLWLTMQVLGSDTMGTAMETIGVYHTLKFLCTL